MSNAGSSVMPPGPSSEQESEIKAHKPGSERPKDQDQVKRTPKLRSDKTRTHAAGIRLPEEKEKSAIRKLGLDREIERLQAERAQLDKLSSGFQLAVSGVGRGDQRRVVPQAAQGRVDGAWQGLGPCGAESGPGVGEPGGADSSRGQCSASRRRQWR